MSSSWPRDSSICEPRYVLVACEESQAVTIAFRRLGVLAFSCDIKPCSGGYPEWHIIADARTLFSYPCSFVTQSGELHVVPSWDLLIAHPPCTYLTKAGSTSLFPGGVRNEQRYLEGLKAREFFMYFYNAPVPRKCIENPVPMKVFDLPPYSQIVQPFYFGDPFYKTTCLWLVGLPILMSWGACVPEYHWVSGSYAPGDTKVGQSTPAGRSKTSAALAAAMAQQWVKYL